jgi:hypothetical protein
MTRAYEEFVRSFDRDLDVEFNTIMRNCETAMAQANCARDTLREKIKLEQQAATDKARHDHEARVKQSAETLSLDLRNVQLATEKAWAAACRECDVAVSAQSCLLQGAVVERARRREVVLALARKGYEELAALEAPYEQEEVSRA